MKWKIVSKNKEDIIYWLYETRSERYYTLPKSLVKFIEKQAVDKVFDEENKKSRLRVR